jgi:NADH-quinone oxidoreductase subunit L
VGLCSYLLIGYWYENDAYAGAGMKAFLVNRIGDIGFLLGIFMTFKFFGTVSFSELREIVMAGSLTAPQLEAIMWITLALFVGACGKSAKMPLYVWLPDAMAGPTPVSALIHAATMVTAGIYMMTRLSFFFYLAPATQTIVAAVGAATALFAATIALVQYDIKKVLAYSTVSQLGYMVLGCGVGAYSAGVFHLLTHACFKALLFLGAGSVIVAMHHKQDMREMGGLRKLMPVTHAVMLIGVLAIIGFPGLAGFFSKDEILWRAWTGGGPWIWAMGAVAALCTAFYMVRLLMLTFYGAYRGGHGHDHAHDHGKSGDAHHGDHTPHETSPVMWAPLCVLAFLSVVVGYLNVPHLFHGVFPWSGAFEHYLEPVVEIPEAAKEHWTHLTAEYSHGQEFLLMGISVLGMLVSAAFAIRMYRNGFAPVTARLQARFPNAHRVLTHKYYVDEFYFGYIVQPLKEMSQFMWKVIDVTIIDGVVNGVGQACTLIGGLASFRMSGSLHRHGMVLMLGILCLLSALIF